MLFTLSTLWLPMFITYSFSHALFLSGRPFPIGTSMLYKPYRCNWSLLLSKNNNNYYKAKSSFFFFPNLFFLFKLPVVSQYHILLEHFFFFNCLKHNSKLILQSDWLLQWDIIEQEHYWVFLKKCKANVKVSLVKLCLIIERSKESEVDLLAPIWCLNIHLKCEMAMDWAYTEPPKSKTNIQNQYKHNQENRIHGR